jgi:hypothetical protein
MRIFDEQLYVAGDYQNRELYISEHGAYSSFTHGKFTRSGVFLFEWGMWNRIIHSREM